jgi:hypothetical protein
MTRFARLEPTLPTRRSIAAIRDRLDAELDEASRVLAFRPDLQLDWPADLTVSGAVARAVVDALAASLDQLARHRGVTSAFVSVSGRRDAVEVCVVDDGRAPGRGGGSAADHVFEATGVAHDVDDFGAAGICQWWSVPIDLD